MLNPTQLESVRNFQRCTETTLQFGGYQEANEYAAWASQMLTSSRGLAAATEFSTWWMSHPAHVAQ